MIDELHVRNLALISDATLVPAEGLTALTGETGAGKSALLSSIKLLVGERASSDSVRDGADAAVVESRVLTRATRDDYPDGRVVSRRVSADGRSRCHIDGSLASVSQVGELVGATVDLCGQHDHQRLLTPQSHLPLLDAWAKEQVAAALASYRAAFHEHARAREELDRVLAARNESASRVEDARFAISRIDEVSPSEGEYEELCVQVPKKQQWPAVRAGRNSPLCVGSSPAGPLVGTAFLICNVGQPG